MYPSLRETAMHLAVSYCATHQMEDLISIAEQIYEFLSRSREEELAKKINEVLLHKN